VKPARIFWASLILVCGVTAYVGLPPLAMFGHDVFFFLDNAYRVLQGQVPHRDFQSAWGPLIYLIDALGLWLAGMRPDGIGYANAVWGGAVAVWAWRVARCRMSEGAACLVGVYTLLLIVPPFALGYRPFDFSPAMSYNRFGFALLGIVMVECWSAPGWSSGVAWALLGFLKVTYGIATVPVMLLSGGAGLWRRERLVPIAAGAVVAGLAILAYLRFDVAAMLGDLMMAASGRSRTWHPWEVLRLGFGQVGASLPLVVLAVLASKRDKVRRAATAVAILGLGGFLLSTNHQPSELPLNGYLAMLLADEYRRRDEGGGRMRLVVALLTAACLAPLCLFSVVSLAGAVEARTRGGEGPRLESARGAGMVFLEPVFDSETGGSRYVQAVNEGMGLLRAHTGPRDGVLTIDMMNPFNYLMERPSPTGGMAAGVYNYVVSDARHPSDAKWVGNARWVMVRKYRPGVGDWKLESYYVDGIRRIYQPLLDREFARVGETGSWVLWGKK
jgi:hypothetical protein